MRGNLAYRSVFAALAAWLLLTCGASAAELSTSDRLKDRRYVTAGERAYVTGFEDGRFYGQGWHINGEMGGVWSQPLKFVDGVWFGIGDEWVGPATEFTSGWGYVRMGLPPSDGLQLSRTDFVPDGRRAALFGLTIENPGAERTVSVKVDAHSELLGHYPWTWTTPNAVDSNLSDTGSYDDGTLVFQEQGTPPHPNAEPHDWAALVASDREPAAGETGAGHWGPQEPPEPCAGEPPFCDEGAAGKGTGGQLRYEILLPAGGKRTLWIAVAGSDDGVAGARAELNAALADPDAALAAKIERRQEWARWTKLSLPGDPLLADGVDWGKQNLLDLTQRADDLEIRDVDEGRQYPPPQGSVDHVRFVGAGYPDYPWMFATDGEYTAFANVAVGQFESIKDHARALRDASLVLNGNSGKVAHEIVADGSVYFGANNDPGNTDETVKFPSMVALIWRWSGDNAFRDEMYDYVKSNLRWVLREEDEDGDLWPEGRGNVEREGMGDEKLDNAVYMIRALYDVADMARSKRDGATLGWAQSKARNLEERFEAAWWMAQVPQYADSLTNPGNVQQQDRHWIGVNPMEAELVENERAFPGVGAFDHGAEALDLREEPCYSGTRPLNEGLFHTGSSGCDGWPDPGTGEKAIFSLGNAVMAVGEGNYGRLGERQQRRYTDANRETMLPEPDEQPGALPEIVPSPDFGRNVNRCTTCRSMVMQAWGNYGTAWPVVHQQLGVRPDMGRGQLEVVPQLPSTQPIAGENIRLGGGAADVAADREGGAYRTTVDTRDAPVKLLRIGHTLPRGSTVASVTLDGKAVDWQERLTNRGVEVTVKTGAGRHVLVVDAA